MIYRVFLQDEADVPNPDDNSQNRFRIRSGSMNAWTYEEPFWQFSIESQLKAMGCGYRVGPSLDKTDGYLLIEYDGEVVGIAHSIKELQKKTYPLAKKQALDLRDYLSEKKEKQYIFIDLTSKGDKRLAQNLGRIINNEPIQEINWT